MRNVLTLCALALVFSGGSLSAQSAPAFVRPAAPGQLVDIGGGRRLHVVCKGAGDGPTVVFEAGLSQYTATSTYGKAQDAIAAFARVCIYDRAGLGWSDAAPADRTHGDMVADLHARLRAGVVAQIVQGLAKAAPGVPVVPLPAGTSTDIVMSFMPEVLAAVKDEYLAIDRTPAALRAPQGYGALGHLPLVVIRRGKTATPPSASDVAWQADQERLTALSTNSSLIVAEKAGHVIPYDAPGVVADAVRRVLTLVATSGRTPRD